MPSTTATCWRGPPFPPPTGLFGGEALRGRGLSVDEIAAATKIDPWFIDQLSIITTEREHVQSLGMKAMTPRAWRRVKRLGFADAQLAYLWDVDEDEVRQARSA